MNGLHAISIRAFARILPGAAAPALVLLLAACGGKSTPPAPSGLSPETERAVAQVIEPYERIRLTLAQDGLQGLAGDGKQIASLLAPSASAKDDENMLLDHAARAAATLAETATLDGARQAFGELSRNVIALVERSPSLAARLHLFLCPMAEGYARWVQTSSDVGNPYMGTRMPRCANPLSWETEAASAHAPSGEDSMVSWGEGGGDDTAVAYYTCPMHTFIRAHEPGTCPVCSMTLVAVTRGEVRTGTVLIDAQRRQTIGIRTAAVQTRPVRKTIRTVGKVVVDETKLADVSLKVGGWIGTLYADALGKRVRKGSPLFTLYSPELYSAQSEYLTAVRSREAARFGPAPDRADYLVEAARQRLRLWDLTDAQIAELETGGAPIKYIPILAPASGVIMEKNVVEGANVMPGDRLFRLAGLDPIWIEAAIYEAEADLVSVGQEATVTFPNLSGRTLRGTVSFIYPYFDAEARAVRARIVADNPDLELRPDMVATVEFTVDLGSRLVVPESSVIYAGPRQFVFLDLGEGRLRPQRVELGARTADFVEVREGLKEGDLIVVSGNFLVAAESRLKTAMEQW